MKHKGLVAFAAGLARFNARFLFDHNCRDCRLAFLGSEPLPLRTRLGFKEI